MQIEKLCYGCLEDDSGLPECPRCGYSAGQTLDFPLLLPPGTVLHDQYVIGRSLGHGGFGITYLAWDMNLERRVAVKEYLPNGLATRAHGTLQISTYSGQKDDYELGLRKFLEEARVLARFQSHPGMVAVQFFFQANGTAYLVMEYLGGCTFDAYLKDKGGRIPFARAMDVLMPVMDALREVHKTGILHRDISPDNIYITRLGPVKLLDFGAARYALGEHSQNFSIILKEGYAPEEQYRSKGHQGPWTDVYACAATLYRAVVGTAPPPALDRIHQDDLEPPSALGITLPMAAEEALLKALAVDASARYPSIEEFQSEIAGSRGSASGEEVRNLTVPLRENTDGQGLGLTAPLRSRSVGLEGRTVPLHRPVEKGEAARPRGILTPGRVLAGGALLAAALIALAIVHRASNGSRAKQATAMVSQAGNPVAKTTVAGSRPSQPQAPLEPAAQSQTSEERPMTAKKQTAAPESQAAAAIPRAVTPTARAALPEDQAVTATSRAGTNQGVPPANPVAPNSVGANPAAQPGSAPGAGFGAGYSALPGADLPPGQAPQQAYQTLMNQAEALLRQDNAAGALQLEKQAVKLNPALPTAYDMMGFTYLYGYGNYAAARQNMDASLHRGGTALFHVRHDLYDGTFSNSSIGMLRIGANTITYQSSNGVDSFTVNRGDVEDTGMNRGIGSVFRRFLGSADRAYAPPNGANGTAVSSKGAFHIRADSHTYNLVGTSSDPAAEAEVILHLLHP
ncbi:MAG: protein kinase domain-containing protein [Acidobacteriota bacterium]